MTDPFKPTAQVMQLREHWRLPVALWGGTASMRAAGEKFLPKEPSEERKEYEARLSRTFLFNVFKRTIRKMTARVFSKPVHLQNDVPPTITEWCENIDMAGNHINIFSKHVLETAMRYGMAFMLVDMPRVVSGATLADERAIGIRPYAICIEPDRVLGWRTEMRGGREVLTQFRFEEVETVPDGEFGEKPVRRCKVLSRGAFQCYEKNEKDEAVLVEEGAVTYPDIPVVAVYAEREGFMSAKCPLEDLAHLNLQHWQGASDQRNILHCARVPLLFGAGFDPEKPVVIGANRLITGEQGSSLSYVEHSGKAIEAGRQDLLDTEMRMESLGYELLMPRTGNATATASAIDASANQSSLQSMAMELGDALEIVLDIMAQWSGLAKEGGSIRVNSDFGISLRDSTDLVVLNQAVAAGNISRQTFWAELKRRNVLMDDFDAETEASLLNNSEPVLQA